MNDIKRIEDKFNSLMDKYLFVVNNELKHYEKEKSVLIENYSFDLSHKIMDLIKSGYSFTIDMSIISDGIIVDLNKVIMNYNEKYESEIINYTKIEDIFMDNDNSDRDRCRNIVNYLNDLKKSYLTEDKFVDNLNEIFAKRITTRILNTKPNITKDESLRLLNSIYALVKGETPNLMNKINEYYIDVNRHISSISNKLSEAMAQMELLRPYMENDKPLNRESRVEKYKEVLEENDGDENE